MEQKPQIDDVTSSPPKPWLNRTKEFFDVPNSRIITLFLISSISMFSSGIAFLFEWLFHGKSHVGFQWIVYYAFFLIFLPVLIWLGFGIAIFVSSSHESGQVTISMVEEEECGVKETEEVKENSCRSLAIVVDSEHKKCIERLGENKTSRLKRTFSYPLYSKVRSCRTRYIAAEENVPMVSEYNDLPSICDDDYCMFSIVGKSGERERIRTNVVGFDL